MKARHSKADVLYEEIMQALQTGRYVPGERIDPGTLADEFHTSPTPVRLALSRLVGEGVIHDCRREGFHVPLPTEMVLRDLYDWMQRLLFLACSIGVSPAHDDAVQDQLLDDDGDTVAQTRQLFEGIARATEHLSLYCAVRQANDKLGPIRRAKPGLIKHAHEELAELHQHWQRRELKALRSALTDYHERRKQAVPRIVALLSGTVPYSRD